jgi:hypothetical protein
MLTSHSSNDSCALVSMEPIYVWSRPSFVIIIQAFIWIYRKYRCDVENKLKLLAASVLQITQVNLISCIETTNGDALLSFNDRGGFSET